MRQQWEFKAHLEPDSYQEFCSNTILTVWLFSTEKYKPESIKQPELARAVY